MQIIRHGGVRLSGALMGALVAAAAIGFVTGAFAQQRTMLWTEVTGDDISFHVTSVDSDVSGPIVNGSLSVRLNGRWVRARVQNHDYPGVRPLSE
jgi:hypothetical protein